MPILTAGMNELGLTLPHLLMRDPNRPHNKESKNARGPNVCTSCSTSRFMQSKTETAEQVACRTDFADCRDPYVTDVHHKRKEIDTQLKKKVSA